MYVDTCDAYTCSHFPKLQNLKEHWMLLLLLLLMMMMMMMMMMMQCFIITHHNPPSHPQSTTPRRAAVEDTRAICLYPTHVAGIHHHGNLRVLYRHPQWGLDKALYSGWLMVIANPLIRPWCLGFPWQNLQVTAPHDSNLRVFFGFFRLCCITTLATSHEETAATWANASTSRRQRMTKGKETYPPFLKSLELGEIQEYFFVGPKCSGNPWHQILRNPQKCLCSKKKSCGPF